MPFNLTENVGFQKACFSGEVKFLDIQIRVLIRKKEANGHQMDEIFTLAIVRSLAELFRFGISQCVEVSDEYRNGWEIIPSTASLQVSVFWGLATN
jgi:hypothetical protein